MRNIFQSTSNSSRSASQMRLHALPNLRILRRNRHDPILATRTNAVEQMQQQSLPAAAGPSQHLCKAGQMNAAKISAPRLKLLKMFDDPSQCGHKSPS